ncbi:MAG: hypothetical protein LBQ97_02740 [Fusobacteriaceae bacterium]|jgi:hypothetical protein|nr:hypothetical protein [Fusobacteriaceae bacterium]
MKKIRMFLSLLLVLTISGAAAQAGIISNFSGLSRSYRPALDAKTRSDLIRLRKGEEPKIVSSDNLIRDGKALAGEGYVLIGTSAVEAGGRPEITKKIRRQCKRVGASVALYSSAFSGTKTNSQYYLLSSSVLEEKKTVNRYNYEIWYYMKTK